MYHDGLIMAVLMHFYLSSFAIYFICKYGGVGGRCVCFGNLPPLKVSENIFSKSGCYPIHDEWEV